MVVLSAKFDDLLFVIITAEDEMPANHNMTTQTHGSQVQRSSDEVTGKHLIFDYNYKY